MSFWTGPLPILFSPSVICEDKGLSLLQNSVSFAEAMQFLALRARTKVRRNMQFSVAALAKLKFCKSLDLFAI